jgi:SAM-dependent methyltransferase
MMWFDSFNQSNHPPNDIYEKIAHERWRLLISKSVSSLSKAYILKTDSWNESKSNNTTVGIPRDNTIIFSDICFQILKLNSVNTNLINSDIRSLPFLSESFSAVLDISTSDHCNYDEFKLILLEYNRILKQNGVLVLVHNSKDSIIWNLLTRLGIKSPAYTGIPPAYYFSTKTVIKDLLASGYRIKHTCFTNYFGWARKVINKIIPDSDRIIHFIAKKELELTNSLYRYLARQHVIVAIKTKVMGSSHLVR